MASWNQATSLAEHLSGDGTVCPIPNTHDRLFELHYWWHEIARNYHEPTPFRYSLGAFLQAARNVTWILQKEKHAFKDFGWYEEWVEKAKQDSLLRWLKETRNTLVKQQALQTESSLEVVCVGKPRSSHDSDDDEEEPFRMRVSPFRCTHYYIFTAPSEDHGHEFIRFWGIDDLKGRELLAGCGKTNVSQSII